MSIPLIQSQNQFKEKIKENSIIFYFSEDDYNDFEFFTGLASDFNAISRYTLGEFPTFLMERACFPSADNELSLETEGKHSKVIAYLTINKEHYLVKVGTTKKNKIKTISRQIASFIFAETTKEEE